MTRGGVIIQYFIPLGDDRDGMTSVEIDYPMLGAWCIPSGDHVSVAVMRLFYSRIRPAYWHTIMALWRLGLLEPHEAAVFSWRRDFRPFPWRGLRRFRSNP